MTGVQTCALPISAKIRDELPAWRDSLVTTLLVYVPPRPEILRQVADLVLG